MCLNTLRIIVVLLAALATPAVGATAKITAADSNPAGQAEANGTQPAKVIEHLDRALIKSMKAGKAAGFKKRRALLQPIIGNTFDFRYIAHTVLGPEWAKLNQHQKRTFIKTFKHYIVATYAARFDAYSDEKIKLGTTQQYRQLKVVHTQLSEASGKTHQFDYLMHQNAGDWKIVNVLADGVSNLSLKRSQYTQILQNKNFASLIKRIKSKTAKLKNNPSSNSQTS